MTAKHRSLFSPARRTMSLARATTALVRVSATTPRHDSFVLTFRTPASLPAAVPMTTQTNSGSGDLHSHFTGRINFVNAFEGHLPATEYPKLPFYFSLTSLYMILGAAWLYLCISHRDE